VTSKWGETSTRRRARFYTISAAGRKQLGEELARFDELLAAIQRVLRPA